MDYKAFAKEIEDANPIVNPEKIEDVEIGPNSKYISGYQATIYPLMYCSDKPYTIDLKDIFFEDLINPEVNKIIDKYRDIYY